MFNWFPKKKQVRNDLPDFWKDYLANFDTTYSKKTPIEEVRFVCFDTETTGLSPASDQILSIGALVIKNWEIDLNQRFECMVHQEYEPVDQSITIHGIIPKERDYSLSEFEALTSFLSYIKHSVLIGHHVSFDISMLNRTIRQVTGKKIRLKNQSLDTIKLARRLLPSHHYMLAGELSLDQLANDYSVKLDDRHTAPGDAFITALLFLKLLDRLQKRGNKTLGDLLRS